MRRHIWRRLKDQGHLTADETIKLAQDGWTAWSVHVHDNYVHYIMVKEI